MEVTMRKRDSNMQEQTIINKTSITRAELRKLLSLGIISAEPFTLFNFEYSDDTIEILQSMGYKSHFEKLSAELDYLYDMDIEEDFRSDLLIKLLERRGIYPL